MEKDLVSVVIPAFNRVHTIERAVRSALSQDYPSIEVIVVDDGSTDGTAASVRRTFAQELQGGERARVKVIEKANGGVCTARNAGMAVARGEFVAALDSDDYWLPGKLKLQVGILKAHPRVSLIWSDMAAVNPAGEVTEPRYLRKMYHAYRHFPKTSDLFHEEGVAESGVRYAIGDLTWPMVVGNLIHTSTVVARAEALAQAGQYRQIYNPCEDQEYYFRVCRTGPVVYVDAVTVHYCVGAADAATAPSQAVKLATSYLRVFNDLIQRERDRIQLPADLIHQVQASAHRWVGSAYCEAGQRTEARAHLWLALKMNPRDRIALKYLGMTLMPRALLGALRKAKRASLGFHASSSLLMMFWPESSWFWSISSECL
jgi:glycosyltransferase involved in cell wall biosynthesis